VWSSQLLIGAPWLDHVDVYLINSQGNLQQTWRAGDTLVFGSRNKAIPGFLFPLLLAPGNNQVLIRVATPDPMILPIFLLTPQMLEAKVLENYFSYGFIYGYLLGFIIFNVMLFFGLRNKSNLLYAIYLSVFMLTNIAYTGHGFAWLWPNSIFWQNFSVPILTVCFCVLGLLFSMGFLNTREHRRLHRLTQSVIYGSLGLLLLSLALKQQTYALLLSFGFIGIYALLILAMGIIAFLHHKSGAGYYLCAAITSSVGAILTIASVWGFAPYTICFRAVEIGMLLDATLLALALVVQIRQVKEDHFTAEQSANTDPLTGINNRRAFYLISPGLWSSSLRHTHALSVILLDIDHFKKLNDTHGHACGDQVLIQLGKLLQQRARQSDLIVRWGGEEFLILLPETNVQDAQHFAERLREKVAEQHIVFGKSRLPLSASFGVAERCAADLSIEQLIARADAALYQAKHAGRNCTRTISCNPEG
jgi:two-component system, sensor histidine kinase LadS